MVPAQRTAMPASRQEPTHRELLRRAATSACHRRVLPPAPGGARLANALWRRRATAPAAADTHCTASAARDCAWRRGPQGVFGERRCHCVPVHSVTQRRRPEGPERDSRPGTTVAGRRGVRRRVRGTQASRCHGTLRDAASESLCEAHRVRRATQRCQLAGRS